MMLWRFLGIWTLARLFGYGWLRPVSVIHLPGTVRKEASFDPSIFQKASLLCILTVFWETSSGNTALDIFDFAVGKGIFATVEQPWTAYSWKCRRTVASRLALGVKLQRIDMCCFADGDETETRTLKPTCLITNSPWIQMLAKRCQKDHSHAPHLCGRRAKAAAAYSTLFCDSVASSYASWAGI